MEIKYMGFLNKEKQVPEDEKRDWFFDQHKSAKRLLQSCPVDIVKLASSFGFTIFAVPLPKEHGGFIYIGKQPIFKKNKVIAFNSRISGDDAHARFIIAHEFAHYLDIIATTKQEPSSFTEIYAAREEHQKNLERDEKEQAIDYIAASLLMPEESIRKEYMSLKVKGMTIFDIIKSLSRLFVVEQEAVFNRLLEIELIKES